MGIGNATVGTIGKGTILAYNNQSSGGTLTAIAELLDIKLPEHTAAPVEVLRYDSPSNYPELIPGWCKGGEVSAKLVYNASQGALIWQLLNTNCQFCLMKPDGKAWLYPGILNKFGDEVPLKDKITNDVALAISGAPIPGTAVNATGTVTFTATGGTGGGN